MAIGDFAYANNCNRFLGCAPLADQPFALVGVPFDGAVSNRPGARFGPQAIRAASLMLCDGEHPHFNCSPVGHVGDALDLRLPNTAALPHLQACIEQQAQALMGQHRCVFLGGDHSITLPLLRAYATNSASVLTPSFGLATSSNPPPGMTLTKVRSLSMS